jgi:hypothetical protein
MKKSSFRSRMQSSLWITIALFLLLLGISMGINQSHLSSAWSNFATVFLGIFIEAIPFLLLGTLASGFVEVFMDTDVLERFKPKSAWVGVLYGCFMGLAFPVCECGVVPLVRRLYKKGLPISTGIAFLLAAPVINPIVIFSTASAFGFGKMLWMRIGFTLLIAFVTGLVFSTAENPSELLWNDEAIVCADGCCCHQHNQSPQGHTSIFTKLNQVILIALDELFEMGRYLVLGSLISAGMQTFIPQSTLLNLGSGAVSSVLVMIALAVLLSICSTVDSFVALSFLGSFTSASVLGFLLYGPMVDIKSTLMFLHVFKKRSVLYLLLIPLVLVLLICITLNYFWI